MNTRAHTHVYSSLIKRSSIILWGKTNNSTATKHEADFVFVYNAVEYT